MTKELVVEGRKYQPSSVLARQFSYTPDYLSKLARDGKINSTKVGRQWFIEEKSLVNFLEEVSLKKEERSNSLREERKLEQKKYKQSAARDEDEAEHVVSDFQVPIPASVNSFLQAFIIVGCGWLVGLLGFAAYEENIKSENLATALIGVYDQLEEKVVVKSLHGVGVDQVAFLDFSIFFDKWFSPGSEIEVEKTPEENVDEKGSNRVYQTEEVVREEPNDALIMLEADASTTTINSIKESFSDEVEVVFDGPRKGMIKPVFKNETDESYRFILVPVKEFEE